MKQNMGSMLVRFYAENTRSFRDGFEISMEATRMSKPEVVRELLWRHDSPKTIGLLPVLGIFGANAAGKSNALRAIFDLRQLVLTSFSKESEGVRRHPFLLDADSEERPTCFELDVILEGVLFEYEVSFDSNVILSESLVHYPKGRAAEIFSRSGMEMSYGKNFRTHGQLVTRLLLRPNTLFLSCAAQARLEPALGIVEWFRRNLFLAEENTRAKRQLGTVQMLADDKWSASLEALIRAADLGITKVEQRDLPPGLREQIEESTRELITDVEEYRDAEDIELFFDTGLRLTHQGAGGHNMMLDMEDESRGTLIWLGLVGPVVDALESGGVLLADELEASLHPVLVDCLVHLFQDPVSNPNRAQLVFNSHDHELMGSGQQDRPLGRDQVYLATKTDSGSTTLRRLSEAYSPRTDEAVSRRYVRGAYGSVPLIAHQDLASAVLSSRSDAGMNQCSERL